MSQKIEWWLDPPTAFKKPPEKPVYKIPERNLCIPLNIPILFNVVGARVYGDVVVILTTGNHPGIEQDKEIFKMTGIATYKGTGTTESAWQFLDISILSSEVSFLNTSKKDNVIRLGLKSLSSWEPVEDLLLCVGYKHRSPLLSELLAQGRKT